MERPLLGEMLVATGLVSNAQLDEALASQLDTGRRLGSELVARGVITEVQLTQAISNQLSLPWVSLMHVEFSRELLNLVPAALAERFGVIPIYLRNVRKEGLTAFVAMEDPTHDEALHAVRQAVGMPVKTMVAPPSEVREAIRVYYFNGKRRPSLVPRPAVPGAPRDSPPPPAPTAAEEAARATWPDGTRVELPKSEPSPKSDAPARVPIERTRGSLVTLTLLDGTTVRLPRKPVAESETSDEETQALTATDLVQALMARASGADTSDVLPSAAWEPIVAALITLLVRKGLIADWEFAEEWQRRVDATRKTP